MYIVQNQTQEKTPDTVILTSSTPPIQKLEDHIDDPIKKCVAGMALLGFAPAMSCCGFTYKGEKVNKKHLGKAYMYLDYKKIITDSIGTQLLSVAANSSWSISPLSSFIYVDFYANTWEKNHPWSDKDCPHYHEKFILAINSLEKTIDSLKSCFKERVEIEDGNCNYKKNVSKYWQYEPTEPWIVTPEIYEKL